MLHGRSFIPYCSRRQPDHTSRTGNQVPYKYYLTSLGRRVALAALKLKELVLIPALVPQTQS